MASLSVKSDNPPQSVNQSHSTDCDPWSALGLSCCRTGHVAANCGLSSYTLHQPKQQTKLTKTSAPYRDNLHIFLVCISFSFQYTVKRNAKICLWNGLGAFFGRGLIEFIFSSEGPLMAFRKLILPPLTISGVGGGGKIPQSFWEQLQNILHFQYQPQGWSHMTC